MDLKLFLLRLTYTNGQRAVISDMGFSVPKHKEKFSNVLSLHELILTSITLTPAQWRLTNKSAIKNYKARKQKTRNISYGFFSA